MKNIKNLARLLLVTGAAVIFSLQVTAQRGRSHDRGGGRSYNPGYNNNYSRNYQGGNAYRGGNYNYRPGYNYRPSYGYGYGGHYNYYPSYRYRPIYRSYGFVHFGPSFGFRLSILPFGYYPFYIGSNPYYYYDGVYYRPYEGGGYEVTAPPLGATVKHLPSGTKATVINGQKYYELGGTYYQEELNAKNKVQYVVVGTDGVINTVEQDDNQPAQPDQNNNQNDYAPPAGNAPSPPPATDPVAQQPSRLTQLPATSKVVTINQQKYYVAPSGIYYQEVTDASNNVSYEAVGGNTTTPDNRNTL